MVAPMCGIGLSLILSSILCAVSFYRMSRRIVVCDKGFLDIGLFGTLAIPWEELDVVYQSITRVYVDGEYRKTLYHYTVELYTGGRLSYDNRFVSIATLGKRLLHEACRGNRQRVMSDFQAGKWVEFGPFRLSRKGIEYAGRRSDWDQISDIGASTGHLVIHQRFSKGAWATCPFPQIPNLPLFIEVIGQVIGPVRD
jgi:hypothetical protein